MTDYQDLIQLCYVSKATEGISMPDVENILGIARRKNHLLDVTGLLVFDGRTFLQVLEGPKDIVHSLYEIIARDPKHYQVMPIFERSVFIRDFAEWSMGCAKVSADQMQNLPGLTDIDDARAAFASTEASVALMEVMKSDGFRTYIAA